MAATTAGASGFALGPGALRKGEYYSWRRLVKEMVNLERQMRPD